MRHISISKMLSCPKDILERSLLLLSSKTHPAPPPSDSYRQ